MGFLSYKTLLVLLPVSLVLFYTAGRFEKRKLQKLIILAASLVFYYSYGKIPFFTILAATGVNYLLSRSFLPDSRFPLKKTVFAFSIILNVLLLALFKYYTFFTGKELTGIIAPAGISYIVFTQIAWLTDSFRGETINTSFPDYLNFILFFPKVLLGPIETHKDLIPALNDDKKSRIDYENMCRGLLLFTAGMAKKLLLEPVFAGGADFGFNSPDLLTLPVAWASSFAYTIQLYLDFSGYCDMAAGLALFFNLDIIQNFNSPYKAVSVNDFWKRWHISLTSFLRKYIYFPLGGSKKGTVRTYVNIMIIYLISGFWHGAGLNFIFWGAYHGILCVLERIFLKKKEYTGVHKLFRIALTFVLVNTGWIFFRAEDLKSAFYFIGKLFDIRSLSIDPVFYSSFTLDNVAFVSKHLNLAVPFLYFCTLAVLIFTGNLYEIKNIKKAYNPLLIALVFVFSFLCMSGVSSFIYFKF